MRHPALAIVLVASEVISVIVIFSMPGIKKIMTQRRIYF